MFIYVRGGGPDVVPKYFQYNVLKILVFSMKCISTIKECTFGGGHPLEKKQTLSPEKCVF